MVMEQVEQESQVNNQKYFFYFSKIILLINLGPVRVGDPLTLIIYMRSKYGMTFFH